MRDRDHPPYLLLWRNMDGGIMDRNMYGEFPIFIFNWGILLGVTGDGVCWREQVFHSTKTGL